jgi:hypothetical protein
MALLTERFQFQVTNSIYMSLLTERNHAPNLS